MPKNIKIVNCKNDVKYNVCTTYLLTVCLYLDGQITEISYDF